MLSQDRETEPRFTGPPGRGGYDGGGPPTRGGFGGGHGGGYGGHAASPVGGARQLYISNVCAPTLSC